MKPWMLRHRRTFAMLAMAGVLGGSALGGAGCSTFQNATVARPTKATEIPPEAWPFRDRERASAEAANAYIYPPDWLERVKEREDNLPPQAAENWRRWNERKQPVESAALVGEGVLRVYMPREPSAFAGAGESPQDSFGRVMRFLSYSNSPDRPVDERDTRMRTFMNSVHASAQTSAMEGGAQGEEAAKETYRQGLAGTGLRLRLSAPTSENTRDDPRGLLIYFPGLGSSQYEVPLVREMQSRGWAILSVSTPRVWWYEPMKFEVESQEAIPAVAKRIAAAVDDQLAEPAYALEAGLSYVKQNRPMLARKPVVVMGFSAGALFAPAAVARVKDQVDAVVLMGAGGNLLEISQTSDLTNGGVELDWKGGGVPGSWRNELYQRYLSESLLDPVHMVRAFADKPMLLGLAEFDSTVPAKNGRMMAAAMVGADRLNFAMGHRLMFWKLANRAKDVGDWVEKSVGIGVVTNGAKTH